MVRQNYSYCNSPERILEMADASAEYADILKASRERAKLVMERFADRPERLSGWAHDFVCPDCAAQMTFDVSRSWEEGREYVCPVCGKTAKGRVYDEAWVYYYRLSFAERLVDVALQARMGDAGALDCILRYLDFYAGYYASFPLHGSHAGQGCIMSQSLDEAVFAVALLRALKVAGELIPADAKERWFEGLFMPLIEVLRPQINAIHNIPCWMEVAIGMTGLYFEKKELLDEALYSRYGIQNQIEQGYTADGIWYEGSMGYHFYTTECLTYFFSFYAEKHPDDRLLDRFERMYTSPLALSWNGHSLCALNDGWYPISMPTEQTNAAARILDAPALEGFLSTSERGGSVWRLLLDREVDDGITLMADTRLAVFRRSPYAILKGGVLTESHMHRDVLSLRIPPYSDDLGTPGYAHPLTAAWYRTALCHNTVLIDGEQPEKPIASEIRRTGDGVLAVAEAWKGVSWSRRLSKKGESLEDSFALASGEEHEYTWFFHAAGELIDRPEMTEATLDEEGFALFREVNRISAKESLTLSFLQSDGKRLTVYVPDAALYEIYLAKTPGNPANVMRNTLILVCKAREVVFEAEYTVK